MGDRQFQSRLEILESRTLLSHIGSGAAPQAAPNARGQSPALVGSVQGLEIGTPHGVALQGMGAVTPLGQIALAGSWGGGKGALNDKGTMTFSDGQGRLVLSLKTHGYFPLRSQNAEEIRVTVQTRSATGTYAGIQVAGTINLVNPVLPHHPGVPIPFTSQIDLKPK